MFAVVCGLGSVVVIGYCMFVSLVVDVVSFWIDVECGLGFCCLFGFDWFVLSFTGWAGDGV